MTTQQSQQLVIEAKPRDLSVSAKVMRAQGLLPAVVYSKEIETINLSLSFEDFEKLYKEAGETTIVDLKIEGEAEPRAVLVKTLQYDPVTDIHIHVDLFQIKVGEKLKATIPLRFEGESLAVKDLGGILITNKDEVEVECLPRDLPKDIEVDISGLENIDDSIAVKDIKIPAGVEILDELDDSIVVVTPPAIEEEEEEVVSEEEAVAGVEATEEKEGEPSEEGDDKATESEEKKEEDK